MGRAHPFVVPVAFGAAAAFAVLLAPLVALDADPGVLLAHVADAAPPGGTLPIVVEWVERIDDPRGGRPVRAPIVAQLVDADERERARAVLALGIDGRSRGLLRVPSDLRGVHRVRLEARAEARRVRLEARVRIADDAPRVVPRARPGARSHDDTNAPFVVRAEGGVCAAELPCDVYVAAPAGFGPHRFEAGEGVGALDTLDAADEAHLRLLPNGIVVRIRAIREEAAAGTGDAGIAAPKELEIPVRLGGARFVPDRAFGPRRVPRFEYARPSGSSRIEVDRFQDGRWAETQAFDVGTTRLELAWPSALGPGVHRFEVRDLAGASLAAAHVVVHEDGRERDALRAFAGAAALPVEAAPIAPEGAERGIRAAGATALGTTVLVRPSILDSRTQRAMGSTRVEGAGRRWLAAAVALLGVAAASYVLRRGRTRLEGSDDEVLATLVDARQRRRTELVVVASMLFAFTALAVAVLLR